MYAYFPGGNESERFRYTYASPKTAASTVPHGSPVLVSDKTVLDINNSPDGMYKGRERRGFPRFTTSYRMNVGVENLPETKLLVAESLVMNMSVSGMLIRTRHRLKLGQRVDLAIPTKELPPALELPKAFLARAFVMRFRMEHDDVSTAALAIDKELQDDMQYALFVEYWHKNSMLD
jgi:hypothetical protein